LFASLHEVLRHYVARSPGSRVWEGRYGFNSLGFAVPKGRAARLTFLSEFAEHAKASGIVQKAIDRSGWSGIRVALLVR
jgi:polar amino acid transport system substrate-binding protein